MSAFDDEFGLFGDENVEVERRSTLGARKIATSETIIDDIEPEDDGPPRRRTGTNRPASGSRPFVAKGRRERGPRRESADPAASRERAGTLLEFLAKRLVSKPDVVTVEYFPGDDDEQPVLELVVDPDDLGKVIGRGGRVAQALRTVVRATAEGKIAVDIYDTQDGENGETGDVEAGGDDTEP